MSIHFIIKPLVEEAQAIVFSTVLQGMARFAVRAGLENASGCRRTIGIFRFSVPGAAGHIVHDPPEGRTIFINLDDVHRAQLPGNNKAVVANLNLIPRFNKIVAFIPEQIFMIMLCNYFSEKRSSNRADNSP